ncbi:NAD(P)/FAD-dependent oxidoreductase, partial [Fibrobacterota bacterium]
MNNHYDFLVIGAGPGGLLAALTLLESDKRYSIALVDRRNPWTEPVACAEAVHRGKLEALVPRLDPAWIRTVIDGVEFVAPNRTRVKFVKRGSGIIINRALMHKGLAEECVRRGAHCNFSTRVKALSRYEEGYRTVNIEGDSTGALRAKVVIDCSGPGKGFARDEDIVQGDFDLEPAFFGIVRGITYPVNYIQMFFGTCYAPGGYAWLFPRDGRTANIGLVIGNKFKKTSPPKKLFSHFLKEEYPGAEIEHMRGGVIACGHSPRPFAVHNLFKAGDAASMVNPISRAGVTEAMQGGRLAAEAALRVIELVSEREKRPSYRSYKKQWESMYGKNNLRLHRAKPVFSDIDDSVFNRSADRLARLPQEKLTMGRIFLTT